MHEMLLERNTVFKYCFEDSYQEEMREFIDVVKHTSRVKNINPEDLDEETLKKYRENANKAKKTTRKTQREYEEEDKNNAEKELDKFEE